MPSRPAPELLDLLGQCEQTQPIAYPAGRPLQFVGGHPQAHAFRKQASQRQCLFQRVEFLRSRFSVKLRNRA